MKKKAYLMIMLFMSSLFLSACGMASVTERMEGMANLKSLFHQLDIQPKKMKTTGFYKHSMFMGTYLEVYLHFSKETLKEHPFLENQIRGDAIRMIVSEYTDLDEWSIFNSLLDHDLIAFMIEQAGKEYPNLASPFVGTEVNIVASNLKFTPNVTKENLQLWLDVYEEVYERVDGTVSIPSEYTIKDGKEEEVAKEIQKLLRGDGFRPLSTALFGAEIDPILLLEFRGHVSEEEKQAILSNHKKQEEDSETGEMVNYYHAPDFMAKHVELKKLTHYHYILLAIPEDSLFIYVEFPYVIGEEEGYWEQEE